MIPANATGSHSTKYCGQICPKRLPGSPLEFQTPQPSHRLTMQPVKNSNVVIPTAPMRICCHNGICQGITSLINPRNTKQIPPSKNMVQWLRPRQISSINMYSRPPTSNRNRYLFSNLWFICITCSLFLCCNICLEDI